MTDSHLPVKWILDNIHIYELIHICACREDLSMELGAVNVISKTQLDTHMVSSLSHHTNTSTMKTKCLIQKKKAAFNSKPNPTSLF